MKHRVTLPEQRLRVWDRVARKYRDIVVKHEARDLPVRTPQDQRRAAYLAQTGRTSLTPRQARRLAHKEH